MEVVLIKYNAGNIQSVLYALDRIGVSATVTDDHEQIRAADRVLFPGVGEARSAMESLQEKNLDQLIKELKQPVLGICVGMQLLCEHSEERDTQGLGVFDTRVKRFPEMTAVKVPQIGWNTIHHLQSPLFTGLPENSYIYYVHSYYAALSNQTIAQSDYGLAYSAALQKDNFYGVQFHAEKSAAAGERILRNFIELKQG
ncbi:MAG: imidazole glycerol phosphate synthase subunit HisH [Chitinophagaceae bacterium]